MKRIFGLWAVFLLAASCIADTDYHQGRHPEGEDVLVSFRVKAPGITRPGTRAVDTAFENDIERILVFVLNPDSSGEFIVNNAIFIDSFESGADNSATFTTTIPARNTPTRLIVLANYPSAYEVYGYTDGAIGQTDTWLRESNIDSYPPTFDPMPMSGEITLEETISVRHKEIEIPMIRSFARVDVILDPGVENFVPESVEIYHYSGFVQAIPDLDAYNADRTAVTATSIWEGSSFTVILRSSMEDTPDPDGRFSTAYIAECPTPGEFFTSDIEAACVIVGGSYNGGETTYYRIDFNSGKPGHPFGQVLRNYLYSHRIVEVSAPGHPTKQDAANSVANSMVVETVNWGENGSHLHLFDNGGFADIYDTHVEVPATKNSTNAILVRTTEDIEWALSGALPATRASLSPAIQSNENFTVTVTPSSPAGTGYTDYTFTVMALDDNFDPGVVNSAKVTITIHDQLFIIDITQLADTRKIVVYSAGSGMGSLGDSFGVKGQADPVKALLTDPDNFGPTGKIRFGGFLFDYDNDTGLFTDDAYLSRLDWVLEQVDILVLPYGTDPGVAHSQLILEWLRRPGKVIFMSCEVGAGILQGSPTNLNLRDLFNGSGSGFGYSMPWRGALTEDLIPAVMLNEHGSFPVEGEADPRFFSQGAFSKITSGFESDLGVVSDNVFGRVVVDIPSQVVPLIYRWDATDTILTDPEITDDMFMGVDPTNRVVYYGATEIAQMDTAPMLALWGNVWAWAVQTVRGE